MLSEVNNIAAIDMGSNAIRVSFCQLMHSPDFISSQDIYNKIRFPFRPLNSDGYITVDQEKELHQIFNQIAKELALNKVKKVKAIATSAYRNAKNGQQVLSDIYKTHGVSVEIVDGALEAALMSQCLLKAGEFKSQGAHLHVDIGGGSVELSVCSENKIVFQKCFEVGTLRLLKSLDCGNLNSDYSEQLDCLDLFFNSQNIKKIIEQSSTFRIHGTGGNFKRLKLLNSHTGESITKDELSNIEKKISKLSPLEISKKSEINLDNAPLIKPTLKILKKVFEKWPANEVKVSELNLTIAILNSMLFK